MLPTLCKQHLYSFVCSLRATRDSYGLLQKLVKTQPSTQWNLHLHSCRHLHAPTTTDASLLNLEAGHSGIVPFALAAGSRQLKPVGGCTTTTTTTTLFVAGTRAHPASLQLKKACEPPHPQACSWQAWRHLRTTAHAQTSCLHPITEGDHQHSVEEQQLEEECEAAQGAAHASPADSHVFRAGNRFHGRGLLRDPAAMEVIASSGLPAHMKRAAQDAQQVLEHSTSNHGMGNKAPNKLKQSVLWRRSSSFTTAGCV